ncbi:MAG: hypothetical protein ACRD4S_01670 [Candidatus Acidiferrales bacterium]
MATKVEELRQQLQAAEAAEAKKPATLTEELAAAQRDVSEAEHILNMIRSQLADALASLENHNAQLLRAPAAFNVHQNASKSVLNDHSQIASLEAELAKIEAELAKANEIRDAVESKIEAHPARQKLLAAQYKLVQEASDLAAKFWEVSLRKIPEIVEQIVQVANEEESLLGNSSLRSEGLPEIKPRIRPFISRIAPEFMTFNISALHANAEAARKQMLESAR